MRNNAEFGATLRNTDSEISGNLARLPVSMRMYNGILSLLSGWHMFANANTRGPPGPEPEPEAALDAFATLAVKVGRALFGFFSGLPIENPSC